MAVNAKVLLDGPGYEGLTVRVEPCGMFSQDQQVVLESRGDRLRLSIDQASALADALLAYLIDTG